MTPILIMQSLSALRLEHTYPLKEHSAGSAALSQREAELTDAQVREVDPHATADALLQAMCTGGSHDESQAHCRAC